MMLPLILLLVLALGALVVIVAVLLWPKSEPAVPEWGGRDFCDCGAPGLFEFAGSFTDHGTPDEVAGSAMVASYCAKHAPAYAVQVAKLGPLAHVPFGFSGTVTSTGVWPDR